MPTEPAQVTPDDILTVMHTLGLPTVFVPHGDRDPGPEDMPQLIGALTLAVDRLAIAHRVHASMPTMHAWAAGYLQSAGAPTPCGSRAAFETLTVRLQLFEILFAGLSTAGATADLLRALLGAASCYAVGGCLAHAAQAGVTDPSDPNNRALAARQITEGRALITAAAALEEHVRAAFEATEAGR